MPQRDEDWFAKRAGKFTGSRFGDLMAKLKGGKPATSRQNMIATLAVERIIGTCVDTYSNAAIQRGIDLEPEARIAYEARAGVLVDELDFIDHKSIPMCGVSPDGLVDDDGLVELKCPSSMSKHLEALRRGEHAQEYKWQLQGQLWVSERSWVDAVSYDPRWPEPLRLAVVRVQRDEKAISELAAEVNTAEAEVSALVEELNKTSATNNKVQA